MQCNLQAPKAHRGQARQRGMTVVVVLVLLSIMLMGGLALARLGEVGTLVAGNVATKEAAMQASQIGTMTAFQAVQAPAFDESVNSTNAAQGIRYFAKMQPLDAYGMPAVAWDSSPELVVGRYSVRTVVERMCDKDVITDMLQDCLVREVPLEITNATTGDKPEPPNARQFRVTVRVTDPKGTQTFVQAMVSRT